MPDNVLGDVFEELKDTAKVAAQQANPLDILETGMQQVTGQQKLGTVDEKAQQKKTTQQITQMKQSDDKAKKPELEAIRQNLMAMMQSKPKPQSELPKNISGAVGAPKTIEDWEKQEEKIKKQKKKLPDLPIGAQSHQGSAEGGVRGVSG